MIATLTGLHLVGAIGLLLSVIWFFVPLFRGRITLRMMRDRHWPF